MDQNKTVPVVESRKRQEDVKTTTKWCLEYFTEFLTESSFHGVAYFVYIKQRPLEVLFWLLIWLGAVYGALSVVKSNWDRFQLYPTVISMDRNFMEFNTTFPSMTICSQGHYNTTRGDDFITKTWGKDNKKQEYYRKFLQTVANVSYDNLDKFQAFDNDTSIPQIGYYQILQQISLNFPGLMEGITSVVGLEMTDRGFCYSTNSAIKNYAHDRRINELKSEVQATHLMVHESGSAWSMVSSLQRPTNFHVHSPFEISEVTETVVEGLPSHVQQATYKVLEIVATAALRTLGVKQRQCRFYDESNLKISPLYSFTVCRLQCRMELAIKVCRCSPYFYPLANNLQNLLDPVTDLPIKTCGCMTPCHVVAYTTAKQASASWSESSQFLWLLTRTPRIQLQRSVLYGPVDLLGTVGFFLGCSLLSGVEAIYFYTLRLILQLIHNRRPNTAQPMFEKSPHPEGIARIS